MVAAAHAVRIVYEVPRTHPDWTLTEETVPESQPHDIVLDVLKALLLAWRDRMGISAQVARNLAVRWDEERPNIGVDPDLCVLCPRPPEGDELMSLCTWKAGHAAPALAIEVVSGNNAKKDYVSAPERYAASGTKELWIFDPKLAGPPVRGGPHRLQLWLRGDDGELTRVYAGEGPFWSPAIEGYVAAVNEGSRLRIASDEALKDLWMTREEAERAAKEAALGRVAELEALLARSKDNAARD